MCGDPPIEDEEQSVKLDWAKFRAIGYDESAAQHILAGNCCASGGCRGARVGPETYCPLQTAKETFTPEKFNAVCTTALKDVFGLGSTIDYVIFIKEHEHDDEDKCECTKEEPIGLARIPIITLFKKYKEEKRRDKENRKISLVVDMSPITASSLSVCEDIANSYK
jgi:hypothetical protein